ncbi:MAG TPA: hypothetical protein VJS44_10720 [Pyrinomonadaceae bacterium]|nr:hypothetical protein [Pyrinomonadaceae bacterium]
MKKLVQIIALSALIATLWLPALASNTLSLAETSAVAPQDEEAKAALYNEFLKNYKTDPKAAYATAKQYLEKFPAESEQTAYLKKWITAYEAKEKEARKTAVVDMLRQQKYAEAFNAAKVILGEEPNDIAMLNNAVFAALYARNDAYTGEAMNYARKSIQLIQGSQSFDKKDETLGWLNAALGFFSLKTNPSEAINFYVKAAGFEGATKKDPQTYVLLAEAYRNAEYTKLAADFKTRCSTGEQQATPDCKALSDRLNAVVDRMIDAYARAVALATDPKYATLKTDVMKDLTAFYKFRHENTDTGLTELIAGILAKPLPSGAITTATPPPATSQTTGTTNATGTTTGTTTGATTTTTPASTTNTGSKPPRQR